MRGIEFIMVCRNGDRRILSFDGKIAVNRSGEFLQTHCIMRDVTEIRKAEENLLRAQADLRDSEARMRAILDSAQDMVFLKDREGRFTHANQAVSDSFGVSPEQVIGRLDRDFYPRFEDALLVEAADREVLQGKISRGEYRRLIGGRERIIEAIKVPVRSETGRIIGIGGISRDITEQYLNREQLHQALEEKNLLLRELYHRTKNNLQVIISMLSLRSRSVTDEPTRTLLQNLMANVHAMALVHQKLYESQNLSRLDLGSYIREIVGYVLETFRAGRPDIRARYSCTRVEASIDTAMPLGLVLSELVSNAMKYAFPDGRPGTIRIGLRRFPDGIAEILVADDGIGLPSGLDPLSSSSPGLGIARSLVEIQLDGTMQLVRERPGTAWRIRFPAGHAPVPKPTA